MYIFLVFYVAQIDNHFGSEIVYKIEKWSSEHCKSHNLLFGCI